MSTRLLDVKAVISTVRQHIDAKEPFSLIRLGDGEVRLIGYPQDVRKVDLLKSLAYWYGPFPLRPEQVVQLRSELMEATRKADMVGLPTQRQMQHRKPCKLLVELVERYGLVNGQRVHCGVHRALHTSGGFYELLAGLPKVSLITCRDVCDLVRKTFNIIVVRRYPVPPEAQSTTPQTRHYPDRHYALIDELCVDPGEVFLVGAGPNGKVYCDKVRDRGGIALDIGSIFDGWAGVGSRTYLKQEASEYRL